MKTQKLTWNEFLQTCSQVWEKEKGDTNIEKSVRIALKKVRPGDKSLLQVASQAYAIYKML